MRPWIRRGHTPGSVVSHLYPGDGVTARGLWVRALLIGHVVALVLVRVLRDADDFVNWDLTAFLNANVWDSLWDLLNRSEVHFRNPFFFPQYNVGGESVISMLLFRAFGHVSLYWSNVAVLLVYDAAFLTLLGVLLGRVYRNVESEAFAWLLFSMSPTLLTFLSTSTFNVQAYCDVLLGLLGCQYVLEGRVVRGGLLLTLAFVLISQAYPLAFYLPYFAVVWTFWSLTREWLAPRKSLRLQVALGGASLAAVATLALAVNHLSKGAYFRVIRPTDPYAAASSEAAIPRLARSSWFFLQEAFAPVESFDGVRIPFAPYFLLAAVLLGVIVWLVQARRRANRPERLTLPHMLAGLCSLGLILFGYVPGFISVVVKNQRAFFGDLFLVIVAGAWLQRVLRSPSVPQRPLWLVLAVLIIASDAFYLSVMLAVDHSRNHWPRFDLDRVDGIARHDLMAAIEAMRRQVEEDDAGLVIYYPRGQSENTTDPAMFFAHFLRHFGRYSERADLVFPCHWCRLELCSWCSVYGCPFPEVIEQRCGSQCCYRDPLTEIFRRPELGGKRMVLWWYKESQVEGLDLTTLLAQLNRHYTIAPLRIPDAAIGWTAYELSPLAEHPLGREGGLEREPRQIVIASDDSAEVIVNGLRVGEVNAWQVPGTFVLPLWTERVLVAVAAKNGAGPGGLVGALIDPERHAIWPAHWVCSADRQDGWYLPSFDDRTWMKPKVVAAHGSQPWGIVHDALGGVDWVWTEIPAKERRTIYCRWWIGGEVR